jgi:PAS domain S-box-containing protein
MTAATHVTGKELYFGDDDVIVTKTDLKGRITYANRLFMSLSGLNETDCLDKPHSLIRHPDMPRSVFQLLWDTIRDGREIFAYVKNRAMNGDHYWVFAHVTPSFDAQGKISGYHSTRRKPQREILQRDIIPLYDKLLDAERKAGDRKLGQQAGVALLETILQSTGKKYDEYVLTL